MNILLGSANIGASGTASSSHPNTTTSFYQLCWGDWEIQTAVLHSHVADFIYITRWQHLRCSFIFPFDCFHREIIHWTCLCVTYICLLFNREIWFIDVFTLLYCLKNTPTPSLWSHLIWGYCLENYNIYYSPVPGLSIFQFLITYSM